MGSPSHGENRNQGGKQNALDQGGHRTSQDERDKKRQARGKEDLGGSMRRARLYSRDGGPGIALGSAEAGGAGSTRPPTRLLDGAPGPQGVHDVIDGRTWCLCDCLFDAKRHFV